MSRKWDARFTELAAHVAQWSKDPTTKVGAVLVDQRNRVVSLGFNGPPRGVVDDPSMSREEKLKRTIHAEENALLFARQDVEGCTIYVTHPPCGPCTAKLIQAGVERIVVPAGAVLSPSWAFDLEVAAKMLDERGKG